MREVKKIAAVIPAAGMSSRMKDFKPLMKLNGKTLIEKSITCFLEAGISDIKVVTGHRGEELELLLDSLGISYIRNEDYKLGMFSSIQTGVKSIADSADAFFILPGDIPLIKSSSIKQIIETYKNSGYSVIYPAFLGEKGHPPLIGKKCFHDILTADLSGSLRTVLQKFEHDSYVLELIDHTILLDMDTPDDFSEAARQIKQIYIPTHEEQKALYLKYKTPENVIKHCMAVSDIAATIAELINMSSDVKIDTQLVRAASNLHDIVRDRPRHDAEGAAILNSNGFPEAGSIISSHMDIEFNENSVIDEAAVVYLADKFVMEDLFISIEERFAESIDKYRLQEDALNNILSRKRKAVAVKEKIERLTGTADLEDYLKKILPEYLTLCTIKMPRHN